MTDTTDESDRLLWASVIMQAREDIFECSLTAPEWSEAADFFVSMTPYWRKARTAIAAHVNVHADALVRVGRQWIVERRRRDGLPDDVPPPAPVVLRRSSKPEAPVRRPILVTRSVAQAVKPKTPYWFDLPEYRPRGQPLPPPCNPFSPAYRKRVTPQ